MKKILVLTLFFALFGVLSMSGQTRPEDCPAGCFDEGPNGVVCGRMGYYDGDGDGYGSGPEVCYFPGDSNYTRNGGDCNDNSAAIRPRVFYVDSDGDGYGSRTSVRICRDAAIAPTGYSSNFSDCDDDNPNITVAKDWYQDYDSDTYGDTSTRFTGCNPPSGMINPVNRGGDRDDTNGLINHIVPRTFYYDGDGDDYGTTSPTVFQSVKPENYSINNTDCDDTNEYINPTTIWYIDSDGDGLGSSTDLNVRGCAKPPNNANGSYVLSNTDLCPDEYGSLAGKGCANLTAVMATDDDKNWVWSVNYNAKGSVIGNGVNYFDVLGKLDQNQNIDIVTGKIWTSQTLYDSEGMPALQTLDAPIGSPSEFTYKPDFISKVNGSTYTRSDFEADPENPTTVGEQNNSLGWYYSDSNNSEEYQDATYYPFSRTIYSKLNPGSALKNVGGNKIHGEWPQAYSFSMPATDELSQTNTSSTVNYSAYDVVKTVTRDVHGVENVIFVDTDGKTLAAARSGGATASSMRLRIGEQGYVDVHVPKGITGITINNSSMVTVYDLITEQPVSASPSSLGNGFYRVAVNNLDTYTPNTVYVDYRVNYYDHSLNKYDDAGRLIASYQPLNLLKTIYEYNALGQLTYTKSPDEGEAWFKYRKDGQIRYSQNSKQKSANEFSYTNYDDFGRPVESGVVENTSFSTIDPDDNALNTPSGVKKEQLYTTYDVALDTNACATPVCAAVVQEGGQAFVNGNVSKTENDQNVTYYGYDAYGRVLWLVQDIAGLGVKTIHYTYDPVTGLTTFVDYQKNTPSERFQYRYTYNELNQLVKVETSTNATTYITHAEYQYYETGALKRLNLAEGLQGVDYVYNLAGQLKSINHPSLQAAQDPGGDGNDLFGMIIDYHAYDYYRPRRNIKSTDYGIDQYNGNIKGIRWNSNHNPITGKEHVYSYQYNRNNWLSEAEYGLFTGDYSSMPAITQGGEGTAADDTITTTDIVPSGINKTYEANNSITLRPGFHARSGSTVSVRISRSLPAHDVNAGSYAANGNGDYKVDQLTYDANGNVKTLNRKKNTSGGTNHMDDLTYQYKVNTNQLHRVDDADGDVAGADDIGDQDGTNYTYNSIGQLTENASEGISYRYNTQGLVTEVQKNGQPLVKFFYNERGHRIKKESYSNGNLQKTAVYVRDAGGNVMAIYNNGTLLEHTIEGNERLGIFVRPGNTSVYQIADHLGNVRATFAKTSSGALDSRGSNDYYPGGMAMPNKQIEDANQYRYGYQGQFSEKDEETGLNAFQLRMYDSRIMRWLSPDPYGQFDSPYLAMGNNWVSFVDPDGGQCQDINGNTIPCDQVFGGEDYMGPTNETLTALNEVVVVWSQESNSMLDSYSLGMPFGPETGFAGSAASIGKTFVYNNDFWLGKNGSFYNQSFNGNQYTGGKHKFAKNLGKSIGRGGSVLGAYSAFVTERAYANNEISKGQRNVDQTVNGIGFLGPYGAAFNIGFNSGYLIEDACNCNIQLNPNTLKEGYWERRSLSIHNLFSDKYVPEESIFLK